MTPLLRGIGCVLSSTTADAKLPRLEAFIVQEVPGTRLLLKCPFFAVVWISIKGKLTLALTIQKWTIYVHSLTVFT